MRSLGRSLFLLLFLFTATGPPPPRTCSSITELMQWRERQTDRHRDRQTDLMDVGLKVGDQDVHGLGVAREGLGVPIDAIGKDSEAVIPTRLQCGE